MTPVERAPDGAWIAASKWQVREVFQKLTAQAFERILQAKLDAAKPAAFPPAGQANSQAKPQNKGTRGLDLLTAGGEVRLLRRYFWSDGRKARDIGSGPTEATCKTLTLRIKRPGMKWNRNNAAAMMNLLALRESGQ